MTLSPTLIIFTGWFWPRHSCVLYKHTSPAVKGRIVSTFIKSSQADYLKRLRRISVKQNKKKYIYKKKRKYYIFFFFENILFKWFPYNFLFFFIFFISLILRSQSKILQGRFYFCRKKITEMNSYIIVVSKILSALCNSPVFIFSFFLSLISILFFLRNDEILYNFVR